MSTFNNDKNINCINRHIICKDCIFFKQTTNAELGICELSKEDENYTFIVWYDQ